MSTRVRLRMRRGTEYHAMQVVNIVEAASGGPTALRYGIWIAALLGAISVFYGVVFAASGGISNVLKDYWPKKDFMPYSERRR